MTRKLFDSFATFSLLLCAAVCVLWAWSYVPPPRPRMAHFGGAYAGVFPAVPLYASAQDAAFVASAGGRVLLVRQTADATGRTRGDASNCGALGGPSCVIVYSPRALVAGTGSLGFGRASDSVSGPAGGPPLFSYAVVSIPHWALVAVTAVLPALGLRRRLIARRSRRAGLCAACGYDLRATPGRCPECGAAPAEAAA